VSVRILVGDAREILATLPAESVHCVVTSPPYWGLRDYGLPPTVWGGEDPGCAHAWGEEQSPRGRSRWEFFNDYRQPGYNNRAAAGKTGWVDDATNASGHGAFCPCGAWRGALGLEPDPALYVAHLVEVFRAVRRVLRDDGTCWVNLGDSYAAQQGNGFNTNAYTDGTNRVQAMQRAQGDIRLHTGLKPKDLVGLPWRVAFALQADGWWLRSEIIWHKPNPMPESVTDRPTKAHEQVFLLAKSPRYFYDAEAIREPHAEPWRGQGQHESDTPHTHRLDSGDVAAFTVAVREYNPAGRSKRSVWTIPSAPFPEAHFATFPPALVEPCVKAGTSERGACPACGAPWRRATSIHYTDAHRGMVGNQRKVITDGRVMHSGREEDQRLDKQVTTLGWAPTCACGPGLAPGVVEPCVQAGTSERGCCARCGAPWRREVERTPNNDGYPNGPGGIKARDPRGNAASDQSTLATVARYESHTLGWAPTCACAPDPKPCVVLDPFAGAGTVGLVADRLGRDAVLIELKPEYAAMAERRIREEAPLLAEVALEGAGVNANAPQPPVVEPIRDPQAEYGRRLTPKGAARTAMGLQSVRTGLHETGWQRAMAERRLQEEAPLLTAVEVEAAAPEADIEALPGGRMRNVVTNPRADRTDGARWNQNHGRGFPHADGQPWARAAPPATGNGHGALAPEQLAFFEADA
jgi:DNA modification methylase